MTVWVEEGLYEGIDSITYNEAGITYNQASIQYDGVEQTIWTEESLEANNT